MKNIPILFIVCLLAILFWDYFITPTSTINPVEDTSITIDWDTISADSYIINNNKINSIIDVFYNPYYNQYLSENIVASQFNKHFIIQSSYNEDTSSATLLNEYVSEIYQRAGDIGITTEDPEEAVFSYAITYEVIWFETIEDLINNTNQILFNEEVEYSCSSACYGLMSGLSVEFNNNLAIDKTDRYSGKINCKIDSSGAIGEFENYLYNLANCITDTAVLQSWVNSTIVLSTDRTISTKLETTKSFVTTQKNIVYGLQWYSSYEDYLNSTNAMNIVNTLDLDASDSNTYYAKVTNVVYRDLSYVEQDFPAVTISDYTSGEPYLYNGETLISTTEEDISSQVYSTNKGWSHWYKYIESTGEGISSTLCIEICLPTLDFTFGVEYVWFYVNGQMDACKLTASGDSYAGHTPSSNIYCVINEYGNLCLSIPNPTESTYTISVESLTDSLGVAILTNIGA